MANSSISAAFERMWQHIVAALGNKSNIDHTHSDATTSKAGFMSTIDKTKLNNTADYVVEQNTSGNWTYRKWNSGLAECWCSTTFSGDSCTDNYGGLYITPWGETMICPLTFVDSPRVFGSAAKNNANCICLASWSNNSVQVSFVSNTNGETDIPYHISIVGKWKN